MNKSATQKPDLTIITDPVESAKTAGLRYVNDDARGISRQRRDQGFSYHDIDGNLIKNKAELDRIKSLIIPPAWDNVWICPLHNGHLQATGKDAKGRKQYRYHPHWRKVRSQTKFNRMIPFSNALPLIRETTDAHLRLKGLPREKVLATVVQLLEITFMRIGNTEYAKENNSYGITTLRDRHVKFSGAKVRFQFIGKSGVKHEIEVNDRRLAKIVKRCRDIPGYELFQYLDEEGNRQILDSGQVNDYLKEITNEDFTAKDFRTWAGTKLAAQTLSEMEPFDTQTQAKKNVTQAIKIVAGELGNRPATCRKYYVHPAIIDAYLEEQLTPIMNHYQKTQSSNSSYDLDWEEKAVVEILKQSLTDIND